VGHSGYEVLLHPAQREFPLQHSDDSVSAAERKQTYGSQQN
jgi:hypothetical protein